MTTAEMLARVRTLIDESFAQFWTATEIYSALTDGQLEYASEIANAYQERLRANPKEPIPEVIRPLYQPATQTLTAGSTTLLLPPDFLHDMSVYVYGTINKPFFRREISETTLYRQANPYLAGNYYYIDNNTTTQLGRINFEISALGSDASVDFNYIKIPPYIDGDATPSSLEPTLLATAHPAIVDYAANFLNKKAKLMATSPNDYKEKLRLQ